MNRQDTLELGHKALEYIRTQPSLKNVPTNAQLAEKIQKMDEGDLEFFEVLCKAILNNSKTLKC